MPLGVGSKIADRYRITAQLARGGMGTVYEAADERLGCVVAVKVLLRELSDDPSLAARFQREALSAARLQHPGIVHVTDFGASAEGELYLVMERVAGRTLAQELVERGRMTPSRAADVVEQALSAVAVAHRAGVVHRDLKPANLMLVAMGVGSRELVKVLDFGLAQLERDRGAARLTRLGEVLGTPSFMAPEQARGESVDLRVDVYSMGVILYCLLTGKPPFPGRDAAEVMKRVLTDTAPRADATSSDVPAELASIAEVAMSRAPERRFGSAEAFARALSEWRDRDSKASLRPAPALVSRPPVATVPEQIASSPAPRVPFGERAPRTPAPTSLMPARLVPRRTAPAAPRAASNGPMLAAIAVVITLFLGLGGVLGLGLIAFWIAPHAGAPAPEAVSTGSPVYAPNPALIPVAAPTAGANGDVCAAAADCCLYMTSLMPPEDRDDHGCDSLRGLSQYGGEAAAGCHRALAGYRNGVGALGGDPAACATP